MCAWIVYFWPADAVFYIYMRVCWCLSSRRRCGVVDVFDDYDGDGDRLGRGSEGGEGASEGVAGMEN